MSEKEKREISETRYHKRKKLRLEKPVITQGIMKELWTLDAR